MPSSPSPSDAPYICFGISDRSPSSAKSRKCSDPRHHHNLEEKVMKQLTAFLLLAAAALWGQSYQGGVRGVVHDPGGAIIADAKVALINQESSVGRATLSNTQGEYSFTSIDPATYVLVVEAPGF